MNEDINTYKIKINEARAKLPENTKGAIDSVDWKSIILGMKDYTPEQLDALEIETELLLHGLIQPEDYPVELEKRMQLTQEQVNRLIENTDNLIFKKIQAELEAIIARQNTRTLRDEKIDTTKNYDQRFSGLPQNIQDAIATSNWKEGFYKISRDHKLNIEQMGIFEEITIKVITNVIHPDQYENEIINKLEISKEAASTITNEVNENILKKIRENLKIQDERKGESVEDKKPTQYLVNEEIPLPPYKVITNDKSAFSADKLPVNNENQENKEINEEDKQKIINPLEEKMIKPVSSTNTPPQNTTPGADPYRELV